IFTTVMHYMSGPPKALLVRDAVRPITAKVKYKVTRNYGPPGKRKPPWQVIIDQDHQVKKTNLQKEINNHISYSNTNRSHRISSVIKIFILLAGNIPFYQHEKKHNRCRPDDQIGSTALDLADRV